jgi:hypothetical protein
MGALRLWRVRQGPRWTPTIAPSCRSCCIGTSRRPTRWHELNALTRRVDAGTDALVRRTDQVVARMEAQGYEFVQQMEAQRREFTEESRAQRAALFGIVDRLDEGGSAAGA